MNHLSSVSFFVKRFFKFTGNNGTHTSLSHKTTKTISAKLSVLSLTSIILSMFKNTTETYSLLTLAFKSLYFLFPIHSAIILGLFCPIFLLFLFVNYFFKRGRDECTCYLFSFSFLSRHILFLQANYFSFR